MSSSPGSSDRDAHVAAWSYDYERILDLIERIGDCQAGFDKALAEGKPGGLKALGLASQIAQDALELRALLQARNERMSHAA